MNPAARRSHPARIAAALVVLWLAACGGPKPPKPTVIQALLQVQPDVNPDVSGRPSPVVVQLYELNSLATFKAADFFSLFENNQATLGAELVSMDQFQLMPGDTRRFARTLQPATQYLGVAAGFRDLEHSQWRASLAVVPNRTSPVKIELGKNRISITSAP